MRFNSYHLTPPNGLFFYAVDGEYLEDTSRPRLCARVKALHERLGKPLPGDPFEHIMAYMCPRLPPGYCVGAGQNEPVVTVAEVKRNTARLFSQPRVNPVRLRDRLLGCINCPMNIKTSCPSCNGLQAWALQGRTKLPADDFAYVCKADNVFVTAVVGVEVVGPIPEACPPGCWRREDV